MGILRLVLALAVVAAHSSSTIFSVVGGREAVILFYIISGFYMALVLNEKYSTSAHNQVFLVNRALRLWIPYVAVMVPYVVFLAWSGGLADYTHALETSPVWLAIYSVLANVFIVGQDLLWLISFDSDGIAYAPFRVSEAHNGANLVLNLPLFTVSIEIYMYLLAPLFLRTVKRTMVMFGIGVAYYAAIWLAGVNRGLDTDYHLWPMAIMYFAMGAIVYHAYKHWLVSGRTSLSVRSYILALAVLVLFVYFTRMADRLLVLMFAVALPVIFLATRKSVLDRLIGELSYPVYIIHIPLMEVLRYYGYSGDKLSGYYVSAMSVLLAAALYYLVDYRVDRYRHRLVAGLKAA